MSLWRQLKAGMHVLTRRTSADRDVDDEIRHYFEETAAEYVRRGLPPEQARRAARVDMGTAAGIREQVRSAAWEHAVGTVIADVRYAFRQIRRTPAFTAAVLATLALGVGATTSIFSIVEAVLLRPLPFSEPDRLVQMHIRGDDGNAYPLPDTDVLAWRDHGTAAFDAIAAFDTGQGVTLSGNGEPERIGVTNVTDRFFDVLRTPAALGRLFRRGDDAPGAPKTIVLGYALWKQRFSGDPSIVGRPITLDGVPHTVVGVMPPGFTFPNPDLDAWRILTMAPPQRRGPFYTWGLARLKPGVSREQAQAELDVEAQTIKRRYPGASSWVYVLMPLQDWVVGEIRRPIYLLFAAVAFLLLIAVTNVANLLLARGMAREREIAVRAALGAGARRIAAQFLVESLVLSCLGAVGAMAVAAIGSRVLIAIAPAGVPRLEEVSVNLPVLVFAAAVATAAGLAFGLLPAWRIARTHASELLNGRAATGTVHQRRAQRWLAIGEIALALVLCTGAGLLIRSFAALSHVDAGVRSRRLLTFEVSVPRARYSTPVQVTDFFDRLHGAVAAVPGVASLAYSTSLPPDRLSMTDSFTVEGQPLPAGRSAPVAPLLFVDEGYFQTMGVPLIAGRFFDTRDTEDKPGVVIVNQTLAARYFPDGSAVGRRLKLGGPERPDNRYMEIVGVVGNVKYSGLQAPPEPAVYLDYRQMADTRRYVVVRTSGDPTSVISAIRGAVASVDPQLAISRVETFDQLIDASVAAPRFRMLLVSAFALLGLALAAIGIYGVLAYAVSVRTRELGIRIALGADAANLLRGVVGEAALLALAGVAIGIAVAVPAMRAMASVLFGVSTTDAVTFAAVGGLLIAVAAIASLIPARRATRIDPMIALRVD